MPLEPDLKLHLQQAKLAFDDEQAQSRLVAALVLSDRISDQLKNIAQALYRLSFGDSVAQIGAIEGLTMHLDDSIAKLADSISEALTTKE